MQPNFGLPTEENLKIPLKETMKMNGHIAVGFWLIVAVSAQLDSYQGRRSSGVGDYQGRHSSGHVGSIQVGEIIDPRFTRGDVIDRALGGAIGPVGVVDRGVIGGDDCYQNEEPSIDSNNQAEWCSKEYNFCNDPAATCRLRGDSTGTCCRPRRSIGVSQYCNDGVTLGIGTCYTQSDCQHLGRRYQCQLNRGVYGTCCERFTIGQRY